MKQRPGAGPGVTITPAGDAAVLVRFDAGPADASALQALAERVRLALRALDRSRADTWRDVMPGYASLLVVFDPLRTSAALVARTVESALATEGGADQAPLPRRVTIPVLYDPAVAPDLLDLAAEKSLSVDELVALHAAPRYRCHMLGFRPGFPFLSGLDPRLETPRLATPRALVPAGAVAIAGRQAGVYPSAGPGGWRILGRTPLALFDPQRSPPFAVEAGDEVVFLPITRAAFDEAGRR